MCHQCVVELISVFGVGSTVAYGSTAGSINTSTPIITSVEDIKISIDLLRDYDLRTTDKELSSKIHDTDDKTRTELLVKKFKSIVVPSKRELRKRKCSFAVLCKVTFIAFRGASTISLSYIP